MEQFGVVIQGLIVDAWSLIRVLEHPGHPCATFCLIRQGLSSTVTFWHLDLLIQSSPLAKGADMTAK